MENTDDKNKKGKPWWQPAIEMFWKVSVWVAGPIVIALFVGKYLDRRYGTSPWIFLTATGISFIISMVAITQILMKYIKNMEAEDKAKKLEKEIKEKDGEHI